METWLIIIAITSLLVCSFLLSLRKPRAKSDADDEVLEADDAVPFEQQNAEIADMRVDWVYAGSRGKYERKKWLFLVDFELDNGSVKTLPVPEKIYELMSVGEIATLVTQGGDFVDFGDKCGESVEVPDSESVDDFEFDEAAPFKEQLAVVEDKRMQPRVSSHTLDKDDLIIFLVDFKIERDKDGEDDADDEDDDIQTFSVPQRAFDLISIGEKAMLMTHNGRFIDFGDKCAEFVDDAASDDDEAPAGPSGKTKAAGKSNPKKKQPASKKKSNKKK